MRITIQRSLRALALATALLVAFFRETYIDRVGVVLAVASSRLDLPIPADAAAIGEVGLGGEVRRVARLEPRVKEAARLGFRRILVPRASAIAMPGAELVPIDGVAEAVAWLLAQRRGDLPKRA